MSSHPKDAEITEDHSKSDNMSEENSGTDKNSAADNESGAEELLGGSPSKRGRDGKNKTRVRRSQTDEIKHLRQQVRELREREKARRDAEKAEKARAKEEKKAARANRKKNGFIKAREKARANLEPFEYMCKGAQEPKRYVWREREMQNGNKFWCPVEDKGE